MNSIIKNIKQQFRAVSQPIVKEFGDVYQFGDKNDFLQYLIDLYYLSSKHQAIIDAKTMMVAGIVADEKIANIRRRVIQDYLLFGGAALEVRRNAAGVIVSVDYMNYANIRKSKNNTILYSDKWIKRNKALEYSNNRNNAEYIELPIYSEDEVYPLSVLLIENLKYNERYPYPDYVGALQYIEIDYRISNYWNNSIRRGFAASHIIDITAAGMTEEEKEAVERQISDLFSGDEAAGTFILNFIRNANESTNIRKIEQNNLGEMFELLNKAIQQEIFIAHRVTSPMLFGVRVEGQLGGRNELLDAYQLFKATYILPKRQEVDAVLKRVFGNYEVKDNDVIARDISELKGILTIDEIRQALGYKPLGESNIIDDVEAKKNKALEMLAGVETQGVDEYEEVEVADVEEVSKNDEAQKLLKFKAYIGIYEYEILNALNTDRELFNKRGILAGIVGVSKDTLDAYIEALILNGYLTDKGNLTMAGKEVITKRKDEVIVKEVRYSYDWAYGFSDKDKKTSRDFCKKLMEESKKRQAKGNLWTRDDIDKISNEVGWDVWRMRGGWYRVKGTEISIPHCRHTWKQHIILKKKRI